MVKQNIGLAIFVPIVQREVILLANTNSVLPFQLDYNFKCK